MADLDKILDMVIAMSDTIELLDKSDYDIENMKIKEIMEILETKDCIRNGLLEIKTLQNEYNHKMGKFFGLEIPKGHNMTNKY